jgi:2-polyprenyl-3-methyl-5-hydroxy-6-metoxy-1,4-benzoquinol methylase
LEKNVQDNFNPHKVEWTPEKTARVWDFYGSNAAFDTQRFAYHSGAAIVNWAQSVISFSEATVVDYGCGAGDLLKHLLRQTSLRQCFGLEFSDASMQVANESLTDDDRFKGVVLTQSLPSPLPAAGADIVLMVEVVEHLEDDALYGTLKEVNRLLKPGGYFVLTTPNREDIEAKGRICPDCGAIFHPKQHVRSWSAETLLATLARFGFEAHVTIETNWSYHKRGPLRRAIINVVNLLRGQQEVGKKHLGVIVRKTENLS